MSLSGLPAEAGTHSSSLHAWTANVTDWRAARFGSVADATIHTDNPADAYTDM